MKYFAGGVKHTKLKTKVTTSLSCLLLALVTACGGGGGGSSSGNVTGTSTSPMRFMVGSVTYDPNLPPEPTLPSNTQVCATLEASKNLFVTSNGAIQLDIMDPNATPSGANNRIAASGTWPAESTSNGPIYTAAVPKSNPDQARIQAALDACGVAVSAQVGSAIAAADSTAATAQVAAAVAASVTPAVALGAANFNISGASAEELRKPAYQPTQYAVRLVVNSTGVGNTFISGPLNLPSGVTLWVDKGVTLAASRDITLWSGVRTNGFCGNVSTPAITSSTTVAAGSSSNCYAFINANNVVNSGIVGDGVIDARGYAELLTTQKYYPMLRADGTCTNTYAAYKRWVANQTLTDATPGPTAAADVDGTPCDNGGTVVDSHSTARYMNWWDLAWLGNMVNAGSTSLVGQSNARLVVVNNAKNFTLYHVTLSNSPNFHVVPSGVDGLYIWGIKILTPSLAAFQSPTGNGNPLYTGATWNADNVKNTDAIDPGSAASAYKPLTVSNNGALGGLAVNGTNGWTVATATAASNQTTGFTTAITTATATSSTPAYSMYFDGTLKNAFVVYNYITDGDDNVAFKGSSAPTNIPTGVAAVDGSRGIMLGLPSGIVVAHNHFYWGHGVSVGSETNTGIANISVYDNSHNGGEEGLRIKTDWARGGEVKNINYTNICMRNMQNSLLFTPYYSTKALPSSGIPLIPNFHDISLNGVNIQGSSNVILRGFAATTYNGNTYGQNPLTMKLNAVATDSPVSTTLQDSDANLTLSNFVNLPIVANPSQNVQVTGTALDVSPNSPQNFPNLLPDCSQAYVAFPSPLSPFGSVWVPPLQ